MTAETLANKVLENLKREGRTLKFPIDPFKMLHDAGVKIVLSDFENLEGIIINDTNNTLVGINKNSALQRQRFTAAHEFCHYIKDLKVQDGHMNIIQCLKNSNSQIEKYADAFAGYLLMPTCELKKICKFYVNSRGYVDFENVTIIAEYFGVSFSACLNRLAYGLNLIEGDTKPEVLKKRIKDYKPFKKRRKLLKNTVDKDLLDNIIDSISYIMVDINRYTGQKFLQNYIFYDNKLEGNIIDRKNLNYILADLNFNKNNSRFFNDDKEEIVMTIGNLDLQKYILTTDDKPSFKKSKLLHSILFKHVPYPEDNGKYRMNDAVISDGKIQPISYIDIDRQINKLDIELQNFLKNIDQYSNSEYIKYVAYFVYKFIVIHPFTDGNGRISRAYLNWLLNIKNIAPIYVDDECRDEYYSALHEMDLHQNLKPFIIFIEKRILNTLMELHEYIFADEIDDKFLVKE